METKGKNISLKAILIAIGAGIWVIVLQNAGIIPKLAGTENGTQTVYVTGGNIDADVSGSVRVDNEVDINISSVNGRQAKSYSNGLLGVSCQ
jgi:hypothetical protein